MGSATEIIYRKKNLNHQSPLATNDRKPPKARFPRLCHLSDSLLREVSRQVPRHPPSLSFASHLLWLWVDSNRVRGPRLARCVGGPARARRQTASLDKRHICIQTQIVA